MKSACSPLDRSRGGVASAQRAPGSDDRQRASVREAIQIETDAVQAGIPAQRATSLGSLRVGEGGGGHAGGWSCRPMLHTPAGAAWRWGWGCATAPTAAPGPPTAPLPCSNRQRPRRRLKLPPVHGAGAGGKHGNMQTCLLIPPPRPPSQLATRAHPFAQPLHNARRGALLAERIQLPRCISRGEGGGGGGGARLNRAVMGSFTDRQAARGRRGALDQLARPHE
jgi:hypothetical protein